MLASEVDRYKVIDTDTHVMEPYDLWTSRVSVQRWGDLVPHVKWDEELEEDMWFHGDKRIGAAAGAAQAGWHQHPPLHPPSLDVVDAATWDPRRRLQKMDEFGIWAQVLYPNVAGFGAGRLLTFGDPALMLCCVEAYNDFLAEFAATDLRRFVPIMALPMWDLKLCEAEVARCMDLGHKGAIMTGDPLYWGLPKLADPHWDRLWAVLEDAGLPVNFHIGSDDMSIVEKAYEGAGLHASVAGVGPAVGIGNANVISNLIAGGVCHRFPNLNFVFVESGIGWVPFVLKSLEWHWLNFGVREEHSEYDLLPTEYFLRQMYCNFLFETETVKTTIEQMGADWILYESDFPHPTCMAPGPASIAVTPRQFIADGFGDLPDATLRKILHDNASALYRLD